MYQEFRPRNIARLAMYGQKERLLSGDLLWLCAGCYTCYERCPQEVHVSEIISALRKLALNEGKHPSDDQGSHWQPLQGWDMSMR